MDPNNFLGQPNFEGQMHPGPNQMVPNLPQQPMFYPQNQGYQNVDFSNFQPDPNVLNYQQNYPAPPLNVLPPISLPTEPLPQMNLQPQQPQNEKKKTPTKSKRKSNESAVKIPEYVKSLLEKRHEGFNDPDFAERALSNLARKIASQTAVMDEWKRAIYEGDTQSGCVCVPRPKDGRMTITKATGNSGCKKVFPQIFVCQVFRWPNIVFHHDIKSSAFCAHPGVIKPPNQGKEESTSISEDGKEVICVNPFHYDLTPEVELRSKKQQNKKAKIEQSDDEESDDEILHYEDDGIDYAKLWDSQKIQPKTKDIQPITMENVLKELQIFKLDKDLKKFNKADDELVEKLKLLKEFETVIKSGHYKKLLDIKDKKETIQPDQILMPPPQTSKSIEDPKKLEQPKKSNEEQPKKPNEEEEDNAIQNLLDDIRGSFERQFDDDFNLAERDESRGSSPFGNINIGPTFSMSDGQNLEDLAASAEDLLAASPDEMPLEGWSMSQEVFDNFLEAATTSNTENQFNFQQQF